MNISGSIIDAHVHCGVQDDYTRQALEHYIESIKLTGIEGAVMFPPVIEIYDRYNPHFEDSSYWRTRRRKANEYIETLASNTIQVIPYFFIWNDFAVDQISSRHKGIKWHRHMDEPVYHYNTPGCRHALDTIRSLNMPVVYEEEFENTLAFVRDIAEDVRVIIPHLGGLNGSYHALKRHGIWNEDHVYTDTALAGSSEIKDYIREFGTDRILFGSDFPFGDPKRELSKIFELDLSPVEKNAILAGNLKKLLADSNSGF
ncbi:MAG: amidohydrolase family protein [Desulfarculaceae bacterium]|nr:amidohydrolase family protein [Desulfarculaceae bacterium]